MTQAIAKQILATIYGHGRGWAFSPKDFSRFARPEDALGSLAKAGTIRRVIRGIYDYPRFSDLLQKPMSPDVHQVANALARKFGWNIVPDGTSALNLIGISTQVPGQYLYLTDGPSRSYKIGKTSLNFKHAALKEMKFRYDESAIIVHALKSLGEARLTDDATNQIRNWLPLDMCAKVREDTSRVTGWVYQAVQRITEKANHG
jgi:hypothetical protein